MSGLELGFPATPKKSHGKATSEEWVSVKTQHICRIAFIIKARCFISLTAFFACSPEPKSPFAPISPVTPNGNVTNLYLYDKNGLSKDEITVVYSCCIHLYSSQYSAIGELASSGSIFDQEVTRGGREQGLLC